MAMIANGQPTKNLKKEIVLFITKGVNRAKLRSSNCRSHTKNYANRDRKTKGQHNRP